MISADDLILSLDDGSFDFAMEKTLDSLDQGALDSLMRDMEARVGSILDPDKRHIFKNGISAIKMTLDFL